MRRRVSEAQHGNTSSSRGGGGHATESNGTPSHTNFRWLPLLGSALLVVVAILFVVVKQGAVHTAAGGAGADLGVEYSSVGAGDSDNMEFVAIQVVETSEVPSLESRDGGPARASLGWLLHPLAVDEWAARYWDKEPVLIRRPRWVDLVVFVILVVSQNVSLCIIDNE